MYTPPHIVINTFEVREGASTQIGMPPGFLKNFCRKRAKNLSLTGNQSGLIIHLLTPTQRYLSPQYTFSNNCDIYL
ncbi:MAG: hypothetical protein MJE68_11960 [Proteobacteria bacterium]|nr:hypothetical protein [Pseudomonadota bacterium]